VNINVSYRHLDKAEKTKAREDLTAQAEKSIEPLLEGYDPAAVHLRGSIEKHTRHELYRVLLELKVPGRLLVFHEEGEDLHLALREALAELERQLKKHKSLARNEPLWRQNKHRRKLKAEQQAASEAEQRQLFRDLIRSHLDGLYNFARREIAYLTATGDLLPGQISPDDVVDSVMVRAYEQQAERPSHLEIDPWLRKLALDVLNEQVAKQLPSNDLTSLENPVGSEVDEDEQQLYEFYQPDEVLKLEDLVATPEASSPEQAAERHELALRTQQALAWLPRLWRQVVVLGTIEGMSDEAIAGVLDIPQEMVATLREFAEAYLREKLRDSGFTTPLEEEDAESGWVLDPLSIELPAEAAEEILSKFA